MSAGMESWAAVPPPAAANHPNRPPSSCDRHPNVPVIGFCASCLRERLAGLEASSEEAADAPRKSVSSVLRFISSRPELRRSKSFSVSQIAGFASACEPQRRSCDVRSGNTLLSLFHQESRDRPGEDTDMAMKDHIDLDSQPKKISPKDTKEFAGGGFWLAASVFSKKLQNWRRKQKLKKSRSAMPQEKTGGDSFSRRSCDINPRFSLDASRFSFDDPRCSWEEPRASWDGYLIGGSASRSLLPRLPPMLAVAEDPPSPAPAVQRFDGLIPVEEDLAVPGGSLQTRDYYDESSSRGRRSLERSSSARKQSFEIKCPAVTAELVHSYHSGKHERDSREWSSNSLRDECSESFDSTFRHPSKVPPAKKSRRWSKAWNLLGLIHRRGGSGNGRGGNVAESWPELGADACNRRMMGRSNSSVSSRSSFNENGGFGSWGRNGMEGNGNRKKKKKKREDVVIEGNPSSRYSGSRAENGLLRFYLPAMKGSRRRKSKYGSLHSFTGSMLSLY